jgi:hypothetical protein
MGTPTGQDIGHGRDLWIELFEAVGADPRTLAGANLLLTPLRLLHSFRNHYH